MGPSLDQTIFSHVLISLPHYTEVSNTKLQGYQEYLKKATVTFISFSKASTEKLGSNLNKNTTHHLHFSLFF